VGDKPMTLNFQLDLAKEVLNFDYWETTLSKEIEDRIKAVIFERVDALTRTAIRDAKLDVLIERQITKLIGADTNELTKLVNVIYTQRLHETLEQSVRSGRKRG